jgi:hypothetical protein
LQADTPILEKPDTAGAVPLDFKEVAGRIEGRRTVGQQRRDFLVQPLSPLPLFRGVAAPGPGPG